MPAKEENRNKEIEKVFTTDHSIKALDLIDKEKTHAGSGQAFTWWFVFYVGFIIYGIIEQTVWNFTHNYTASKDPTIIPSELTWFIWAGLIAYNVMYLVKHNTGSLMAIGEFAEKFGNVIAKLKPKIKLNKPNK